MSKNIIRVVKSVSLGQVERSGAGATFTDYASFVEGVQLLGQERERMAPGAKAYAKAHGWKEVVAAYREELAGIMGEKGKRT